MPKEDPFSLPRIKDEPVSVEISFTSSGSAADDCMDPANLSIGHSEVSLEGLDREHSSREEEITDDEELLPPQPPFFHAKGEDGMGSMSSRTSTPLERSDSHASTSQDFDFTSPVALRRSSSPKEIHMPKAIRPGQELTPEKILPSPRASPRASPALGSRPGLRNVNEQRPHPLRTSIEGSGSNSRASQRPLPPHPVQSERDSTMDEDEHDDGKTESDSAESPPPMPPSLSREKNYTYDGVMELDPEPQPIDPPRPDALVRAHSSVDEREQLAAPAGERSAFLGIEMEFGGGGAFDGMSVFGRGAGRRDSVSAMGDVHLGDVSALDRLMENAAQGSAQLAFPHATGSENPSRSASPPLVGLSGVTMRRH